MDEYCSKMTEHISKIIERYIKMAYSKHKMTKYCGDGGLGTAARGMGEGIGQHGVGASADAG
jgi:hypothetical protein